MTNVPNEIREMWSDLYRLYDVHYNMENTSDAWKEFWDAAKTIAEKHNNNRYLWVMIQTVSQMIEDHITGRIYHPCSLEDTAKF